ncbi:hypothetical protein HG536_0B03940 [Torulaspora globosa]|uniref:Pre-mRNA polyadenylation factor FIP1 n=1 Tax=Torulaspora globosa TaxID=48254 RepID=A0A7G3ZDE4_9SACH|nr:uncharacterized protein HG536_0B03940 [Torulaspora globosa]QLL31530.1 hypothetical protein HG536_0B03940 [Torulaspora globosa]
MSSSEDEDDRFLYGSDTEHAEVGTKRTSQDINADEESSSKRQRLSNDATGIESGDGSNNSSEESDSDDGSSESDSDSDVEFIISTGADTTRLDSKVVSGSGTSTAAQPSGIAVATTTEVADATSPDVNAETKTKIAAPPTGTIDLNAEGMFEGEPVTSLDPEVLKEKPWRQPGANLSDYFNYGFNEFTWMEYLHRQEKLQQEYNPHKILMGLLTLQQQGNLGGPKKIDQRGMGPGDLGTSGGIKSNTSLNQSIPGHPMPPHGFPPLPMFGGFSPFPMPGMMPPMNPHAQKK